MDDNVRRLISHLADAVQELCWHLTDQGIQTGEVSVMAHDVKIAIMTEGKP